MPWRGFVEAWRYWKVEIWEGDSFCEFFESYSAMLDEISALSRVSPLDGKWRRFQTLIAVLCGA